jgi:hypothetical protein
VFDCVSTSNQANCSTSKYFDINYLLKGMFIVYEVIGQKYVGFTS